ncbi:MAG: hypothetical protein NT079_03510 [Candidatus Omnitrophica bacterium]|nr:hypothetical protein [Candidatus Omnitrophota bacterium]
MEKEKVMKKRIVEVKSQNRKKDESRSLLVLFFRREMPFGGFRGNGEISAKC